MLLSSGTCADAATAASAVPAVLTWRLASPFPQVQAVRGAAPESCKRVAKRHGQRSVAPNRSNKYRTQEAIKLERNKHPIKPQDVKNEGILGSSHLAEENNGCT